MLLDSRGVMQDGDVDRKAAVAGPMSTVARRYPVGAEVLGRGVHFRLWAPQRGGVTLVVDGRELAMTAASDGYHEILVGDAKGGSRYGFRLEGSGPALPDPASRWQPDGPHALSAVVDPSAYRWSDDGWQGLDPRTIVAYEMHVGTFTPEGTWSAAIGKLPLLREAGITMIEMMPVAEFDGRFGWGYDGVDLWAPYHHYGTPDDLRSFVDAAHREGLAVILDVVYNHLGPAGNYLREFAPGYFTERYKNEWGEAINFDGPTAQPVREFFSSNAAYWIDEFHFDGLRLDATQSIFDASDEHVIALIARRVREAGGSRRTWLVAENEPQDVQTIRAAEQGGHGLDAMWNDDFHHAARVALTGKSEAYYTDYRGVAQEFVSLAKHGFLFQGQWYAWQKKTRGTPSHEEPPSAFVWYLQNHDQIANSAYGDRLRTTVDPALLRAMTAVVLLGPATPLLFQGDEFGASAPFTYFADHEPELAQLVASGRHDFLGQFPSLATGTMKSRLPVPHDPAVFARCRIDWTERTRNAEVLALHRDLLRLRKEDAPFAAPEDVSIRWIDGAVLNDRAFVLRTFRHRGDDRLLVVNLGPMLRPQSLSEPLLAPPAARAWRLRWSSEWPEYGGTGIAAVLDQGRWSIPARCALLLAADAEMEAM